MIRNLRATANSVTRIINPNFPATLAISTGNVVGPDFVQIPTYDQINIFAQVQPLSSKDLRQLDSLNIQGAEKAIYLNGVALGVNRIKQRGGDLVIFAPGTLPEGDNWLVLASLEQWGGGVWAKVAVVLQDKGIPELSTDLTDPDNNVLVPAILSGI